MPLAASLLCRSDFLVEAIAKFALEAKFDDFGVDSVSRKLTYSVGHRRFARNRINVKSANLAPNGVLQLSLKPFGS